MRGTLAILTLPLLSLAACGGGDTVNSLGTISPPASPSGDVDGGNGGGVESDPTPTPDVDGGNGGGVNSNPDTPGNNPATFLDLSSEATFDAVGSFQSVEIDSGTGAILYQGNASTTDTPSGTISYNPRDGIFTISLSDSLAGVSHEVRFQDPAHRTDFNPAVHPPLEVPNYIGFNYLEAGDATHTSTFFYQRPGNATNYVSLAGFAYAAYDDSGNATERDHGVMVFGDQTSYLQIPIKGSGHYDGGFVATMVNQESFDTSGSALVMQWLNGSSSVDVDFGTSDVTLKLNGTVGQAFVDDVAVNDLALNIPKGSTFTANGSATIQSLSNGFSGQFSDAAFGVAGTNIPVDFRSVNPNTSTAGASSIDGQFYGPNAVNLGGNFRIIGGIPDQRIDIHGAFTGARQ